MLPLLRRLVTGVATSLLGHPCRLPAPLVARFPALNGVRWRRGGLPPRVGGWMLGQRTVAGITLGHTVFLAPEAPFDPALLLHELAHVHQFERDAAFPVRYLWESIRRGYHANRFETEANAYAADACAAPAPAAPPLSLPSRQSRGV